jgi:hypothetical protein
MQEEVFLKINGYDNYYVSNHGRVISTKFNKIKYLKFGKDGYGYLQVTLSEKGKTRQKYVHRLVTETFINNPNNYNCVDHIDGNIINNDASNLRWVTRQQNAFNNKKAKGYSFHKPTNKWRASICVNKNRIHLGMYDDEESARAAYLKGKEIYHII